MDPNLKPKRLCYILPKYDNSTADHFYHTYTFLEFLSENIDLVLVIENCKNKPEFKKISDIHIQKFKTPPLRALELFFILFKIRLKGYKKFYVHYSLYGGLIASLLSKITRGEVYYWECTTYKRHYWQGLKNVKHKLMVELPRFLVMKGTDYLVTGTVGVGEWYHRSFNFPKENILIIPNDINLKRFEGIRYDKEEIKDKYRVLASSKVALFVHYLGELQGARYIPEIAKRLAHDIENVTLLVVGNGPKKASIIDEIKKESLDRKVFFLGSIPNREVTELFAIADVFIMPSDFEGFPRVLLETMAMGVPFVATDVGGVKETCAPEQLEFVVERGNIPLFVEKVKKLLLEDETSSMLKKVGLEHVKKYSSEQVKEIFISTIFQRD